MFKSIFILSLALLTTACSTTSKNTECKDRANSVNPEALVEYKQLKKYGQIRNAYLNIEEGICNHNCLAFNPKDYDFVEMKFDDDKRSGIYTITATTLLNTRNCEDKTTMNGVEYCYLVEKNIGDRVKSKYKITIKNNDEYKNLIFEDIYTGTDIMDIDVCNSNFDKKMKFYQ